MKYLRESIILRLLCVCITLSWSIPFKASADSFPGCLIENPCDCECDDYREMWPSTVKTFHGQDIQPQMNSGASNCVCPPYNKDTGRVNCLKNPAGVGYPPIWDIIYMNICAEQSPNSNYFAPSIRYRTQICNLGCWTLHGDLTGDGECTVLPSSFGIPTIRICARMAKPAVPASGTPGDINYIAGKPADPGYTPDVNLDFEGYLVDDNPLSNGGYDVNGNPMSTPNAHLQSPKICLYWDPDLLDTLLSWSVVSYNIKIMTPIILGLAAEVRGGNTDPSEAILEMLDPDLMDLNPVQQPNHNDGAINPIFQLLISMTKGVAGLANSLANMIDSIPDYIQYSMMPLVVIEYTLKLGVWILDNIGVEVLKIIGTVNRVVISSFGCVNVPLGPFPPPYCQPLAKTLALPTTYEICPTSVMNDGVTTLVQQSTTSDPCAIAGVSCNPSCWVTCEANNTCDQCTPPTPYGLCVKPLTTASRNNVINN